MLLSYLSVMLSLASFLRGVFAASIKLPQQLFSPIFDQTLLRFPCILSRSIAFPFDLIEGLLATLSPAYYLVNLEDFLPFFVVHPWWLYISTFPSRTDVSGLNLMHLDTG